MIFEIILLLFGGLNFACQPTHNSVELKILNKNDCWFEFDKTTKINLNSIEFLRLSCKRIERSENYVHFIEPGFPTKFTFQDKQNCPDIEGDYGFQIRRKYVNDNMIIESNSNDSFFVCWIGEYYLSIWGKRNKEIRLKFMVNKVISPFLGGNQIREIYSIESGELIICINSGGGDEGENWGKYEVLKYDGHQEIKKIFEDDWYLGADSKIYLYDYKSIQIENGELVIVKLEKLSADDETKSTEIKKWDLKI